MTNTKRALLIVAIFLVVMITFFIIMMRNWMNQSSQDEKSRLSVTGNIQFKGKVINSKVYDFGGRNYYLICVQLDTSNVKSFYVFNDQAFLKIKNNIATMAAGFLDTYYGAATYVEVNMNP